MRIILVGDGKVGHTIAQHLTAEGHDVVIIDQDDEPLRRSADTLDVICIRGNATNAKTLIDAQASRADILIATTASDETNMLCCMMAKQLGTPYVIGRIRDPENTESLTMLQKDLGIDMIVNPDRLTAFEISRLLRYPFASNIESFAKGRVEMVEFRAQEEDVMVGIPLSELAKKKHGLPHVLYAVVDRDGEVLIPDGSFVIQPGDRVHVAADMTTITSYFRYLGRNSLRVRNVMLLGGGRISYYLAKMLSPMGIKVNIIEINEAKCDVLSEQLPEANIIYGDGTDQELLEQENIAQMDAFVALCDRDEENLLTSLFAARQGVPKVIVKNSRASYAEVISSLGLDSVVSPRFITCSTILRYVRGRSNGAQSSKVERLYRMINGQVEALEFIAREDDPFINVPLKDMKVTSGTIIAVIVRKGHVITPFGNDHIEPKDSVVVLSRKMGIKDLSEVIHK